jgi:uracil-DNA glycosylase family 4
VRCAPPDNKPTPGEIARCLPWLAAELDELPRLRVIVALGRIAFDASLRLLRARNFVSAARPAFGHNAVHLLVALGGQSRPASPEGPIHLISSYHPSRQNTNTGKLTEPMFDAVFAAARKARL